MHIAYHKLFDNRLSAYYKCAHHFKHLNGCIQSNIIYYEVLKKVIISRLKVFINKIINSKDFEIEIKSRMIFNESNVRTCKDENRN